MKEVDCSAVRDVFRAGNLPEGREFDRHVQACPHCALLFADGAALGRALSAEQDVAGDESRLWESVDRLVERETGVRAWLRSRATPVRVLIAAVGIVPALMVASAGHHSGWVARGSFSLWVWLAAFVGMSAVCASSSLRSLGRSVSPWPARFGLVVVALGLPALHAFTPHELYASSTAVGWEGVKKGASCFWYGLALALPFVVLLWALQRTDRPATPVLLLAALGGGLVANGALALHCGIGQRAHLLFSHAPIGAGILILLLFARAPLLRAGNRGRTSP